MAQWVAVGVGVLGVAVAEGLGRDVSVGETTMATGVTTGGALGPFSTITAPTLNRQRSANAMMASRMICFLDIFSP